ncbi:exonuclease domain-containing protein [Chloroflexota bacterium]
MLNNLFLDRPLVFIDVETTGLRPNFDRIVELSILKVAPDGNIEYKNHRVNPGIPIPTEATSIHGISDEDVANEPKFAQYAKSLRDFLEGCDLAGFNMIKFDLPFLEAEFSRAGVDFSRQDRNLIDSQTIYHMMEPRDLQAAYLKYCGKEMKTKHTAEGDATAAAEILEKQLEMYPELPRDASGLCAMCYKVPDNYVDPDGKFVWKDGEIICNFGKKHNGWKLKDMAAKAPDYLHWIATSDFSPEVKELSRKAIDGEFPCLPNK